MNELQLQGEPPGVTQGMEPSTYQEELRTFLFLTVVTAPVLAVAIVGGYGFLVWMYQLFTGDLPG
jgi:nitrate reductase NapE